MNCGIGTLIFQSIVVKDIIPAASSNKRKRIIQEQCVNGCQIPLWLARIYWVKDSWSEHISFLFSQGCNVAIRRVLQTVLECELRIQSLMWSRSECVPKRSSGALQPKLSAWSRINLVKISTCIFHFFTKLCTIYQQQHQSIELQANQN